MGGINNCCEWSLEARQKQYLGILQFVVFLASNLLWILSMAQLYERASRCLVLYFHLEEGTRRYEV